MRTLTRSAIAAAVAAGLGLSAVPALAKDYILTAIKPNKLVVVDPEEMAIDKVIEVKNGGPAPLTLIPTDDGKRAYALVNRWESIVAVDLETGEETMRIDLSDKDTRVKAMFGVDLSPDETTLAVYESPVDILAGEMKVQPTRISFYDAETGELKGRTEAPRQITLLMYNADGSKLYGLGRAVHIFDGQTGEKIGEHATQKWERANYSQPDILDVWSQWETANVLSTPYYAARTDMDPMNPEAYWTGILTLDLETGDFQMKDVENTDIFYFSTAVSPTDKNIVYGAYTQLSKFDVSEGKPLKRVELPHSYYSINVSSDGSKVFVGGAMGDIAVYDAETLDMIGQIPMPGGANMSLATMRVFQRDE
ncbi:quinohemoprotein amine dehydrogenase subunit beta [Caenispirillum salinarum]|uniref:quinohemoprotein amine dehydrogenase subunit beta n=1 Tax=Caenispirillum salinarum TaxID=859058 RepID=UPI00384EFCCD